MCFVGVAPVCETCVNQYATIAAGVGYFCLLVLLGKLGIFIRGKHGWNKKSKLNDFFSSHGNDRFRFKQVVVRNGVEPLISTPKPAF